MDWILTETEKNDGLNSTAGAEKGPEPEPGPCNRLPLQPQPRDDHWTVPLCPAAACSDLSRTAGAVSREIKGWLAAARAVRNKSALSLYRVIQRRRLPEVVSGAEPSEDGGIQSRLRPAGRPGRAVALCCCRRKPHQTPRRQRQTRREEAERDRSEKGMARRNDWDGISLKISDVMCSF